MNHHYDTIDLPKNQTALFCSDIHLHHTAHHIAPTHYFLNMLIAWSQQHHHIFLLGDVFEYWLDRYCKDRFTFFFNTLKAKKGHAKLYFMHGNRDFLIDAQTLSCINAQLITDPCVLTTSTRRICLSHGDLFCTKDLSYQRMRRILRHPWSIALAHSIPHSWKARFAQKLRNTSTLATSKKPKPSMLAQNETILNTCTQLNCDTIIHGHVHEARHTKLGTDNAPIELLVLDSWQNAINYIVLDHSTCTLHHPKIQNKPILHCITT